MTATTVQLVQRSDSPEEWDAFIDGEHVGGIVQGETYLDTHYGDTEVSWELTWGKFCDDADRDRLLRKCCRALLEFHVSRVADEIPLNYAVVTEAEVTK